MSPYNVIKESLEKYGIPGNYSCYTALKFLYEESVSNNNIKKFLIDLSGNLANISDPKVIYNIFDIFWKSIDTEIREYNSNNYNNRYYCLRIIIFLLTLDYDEDNLDDYHKWLEYFIYHYNKTK